MTDYKLTRKQYKTIVKASQPVMMIALQCGTPSSPQANANAAWKALGDEIGFDYMTVKPISGKSQRYFTAQALEVDHA